MSATIVVQTINQTHLVKASEKLATTTLGSVVALFADPNKRGETEVGDLHLVPAVLVLLQQDIF